MDLEKHLTTLRITLRSHGYSSSSIRSYAFYIKDFVGWLGVRKQTGAQITASHAMVQYGLHLKEERGMGPSAVNHAMSAVSFFLKHVVKAEEVATIESDGPLVLVGPAESSTSQVLPPGAVGDLTIIRSFLGTPYIEMKPVEPYAESIKKPRIPRPSRNL